MDVAWIEAPREHKLGFVEGKLVCQNPKGKQLATVPAWLKDDPLWDQLLALQAWLEEHRLDCQHTVERWMLRSLPVPRSVLLETWPDPDWRSALQNLVIAAIDKSGKVDRDRLGVLRDIDPKRGVGIVNVDGESQWLKCESIAIPHPILISDLDDLRELAGELQLVQTIDQLYRPVYQAAPDQTSLTACRDYQGGVFEQLIFALGVCRKLGYPVRGGYATCKVWEGASPLEARFYVGGEYPEAETETGDLIFVDGNQQAVAFREVGPVTYSEGVRMAAAIYAKRKVDAQQEEQAS